MEESMEGTFLDTSGEVYKNGRGRMGFSPFFFKACMYVCMYVCI